ncbi:MAG: hypothetical protein HZA61_01125 [Candidatus Eisenbacteria bacterium]|uniref:PorV/PorQ family protein n=1 Tax=Eiseniibacteriota bacterium TaxID=2212470 RepID=A0A933S9M6_UNCEI|nr:hypothetical protein [Candidatus Eisenbacteria bacterium]
MRRRARMREAGPLAFALVLALGACLPHAAHAGEESAGTRAAAFLVQGGGPAVLGMGGAAIGGGEGLQASGWNVAALAHATSLQAYFSHAQFGESGAQDWAAAGGRLRGGRTRWALSATFRDEGTILGRDQYDRPTGDVSATALAAGLQLAQPVGEHFALGAGTRVVSEGIGDERGLGLAFDAGAQARFGLLRLGLSGRDFGGGMRWAGQRWRMPASLGAGVAVVHPGTGLTLALDLVAPANYYRSFRAGAEWSFRDRLALRGGYRTELGAGADEPLTGPAFGLGARAGLAWVDYALVISGDGESSHRFALSLRRPGTTAAAAAPATVAPYGPQPAEGR